MLLSRTATFCPREPLSLHCRKATKSPEADMHSNHIYAIAISSPTNTPTWAISVQPKRQKRLFFHEQPQTSVFLSDDGNGRRNSNGFKEQDLLVKILIAENDLNGLDGMVADALSDIPSGQTGETWLFAAISALQNENLCNDLAVEKFMQLATHTLAAQQSHDSVAIEVDYLAEVGRKDSVQEGVSEEMGEKSRTAHSKTTKVENKKAAKSGKKEGSFFGFWVSRPQDPQRSMRQVHSWERQDDAYGGLM